MQDKMMDDIDKYENQILIQRKYNLWDQLIKKVKGKINNNKNKIINEQEEKQYCGWGNTYVFFWLKPTNSMSHSCGFDGFSTCEEDFHKDEIMWPAVRCTLLTNCAMICKLIGLESQNVNTSWMRESQN